MAVSTFGFPTPGAFSESSIDWSPLANLGNIYQQGQDRATRLNALSQLGPDPTKNAMVMIRSGDPQMAQQGVNLMNQITQQKALEAQRQERIREFDITSKREQATADLAREKFEADDPEARLKTWTKLNPNGDPNSPEARAYIYQQPAQLTAEKIPAALQKRYLDNEAAISQAQDVGENIDRLAKLSPDATSGVVGQLENKYLGGLGSFTPDAVKKSQEMSQLATMNVLQQVRALFPGRVLAAEFKTLQALEHPELFSDEVRQQSYARLRKMVNDRVSEMQRENEGIRSGSTFKPGGGATVAPDTTGSTPKPASDRIINKAKAAIVRGADPKQIRQYMIDNGYDPGDIGK